MRTLIVTNIISVDGFYAGPNDDVMAMPFDTTFSDYNLERLRAADTLFLGRRSFEGFRDYWPTIADDPDQPPAEREISRLDNAIEKVVASDSLTDADLGPWTNTTRIIRRADAHDAVRELKGAPGREILVFGSHVLWNDLLTAGLVRAASDDRLRVPRRRRAGLQRPAHRPAPGRRSSTGELAADPRPLSSHIAGTSRRRRCKKDRRSSGPRSRPSSLYLGGRACADPEVRARWTVACGCFGPAL